MLNVECVMWIWDIDLVNYTNISYGGRINALLKMYIERIRKKKLLFLEN